MAAKPATETPRDPTLREMRATLQMLWHEADNVGRERQSGKLLVRAYNHLAWLLDSYLFDTDEWADDGGRS